MAFHNRIRLPINIDRPQFSATRQIYLKADGTEKTLSAVLKKVYLGATSFIPEKWHERLIVALNHDNVTIEGDRYLGGVAFDGEYNIDWDDQFHGPTATAKFQVAVTPFDNSNANCMTCDELSQVVVVDDEMPEDLDEDTEYTINVVANDSICCYPVFYSISSFNSDYLDSCTIDTTGVVTFHVKTGLVEVNSLKLFTYRVTCNNGGFDEADVFGNVLGTIPGCLAPTGLALASQSTTSLGFTWTSPSPAPDHYFWQLLSSPGAVVLQSDVEPGNTVDITGLSPNTAYTFQVRSECDGPADNESDTNASNWVQFNITTPAEATNTCGRYQIFYYGSDPTGHFTYLLCDGHYYTQVINRFANQFICTLQSAPGVFTSIEGPSLNIDYIEEC